MAQLRRCPGAAASKSSPALATLGLLAWATSVSAQDPLTTLRELFPAARVTWEGALPVEGEARAFRLGDEIGLLSRQGTLVSVFGRDGRPRREIHLASPATSFRVSPRGDAFLATRLLGEGPYEHTVLDAEGRVQWAASLPYPLAFSPSGEYLLSVYDALASHQVPTVFRASTGEKAFSDAEAARERWYLAAAADDTLVFYQHTRLRLIDLRTGLLLWQTPIAAGDVGGEGRLLRSEDGGTIAAQNVESGSGGERRVTRVWDRTGRLLSERAVKPDSGRSNGGVLVAISEGGAWLALDDLDHLSIVGAADGREAWRLAGKDTCCLRLFTDTLLMQERGRSLRVFNLDREGRAMSDRRAELAIEFLPKATRDGAARRALLVREGTDGLQLTELDLGLHEEALPAGMSGGCQ